MLPIAGWVLIARLIHAEALPGTRQFWLTRPYSRGSLLAAKMLFLLIFINLPKLVADAMIVHRFRYSLSAALPGLLWSQVLLFGLFVLPLAALAALTSSTAQLVFSTLFLVLVLIFGSGFAFGPMNWVVGFLHRRLTSTRRRCHRHVAILATQNRLGSFCRRRSMADGDAGRLLYSLGDSRWAASPLIQTAHRSLSSPRRARP